MREYPFIFSPNVNYTTLQFTTEKPLDGALADTTILAKIEGGWQSVYEICDPDNPYYDLGLQLCHDTPIWIRIAIDADQHGPLNDQNGKFPATLVHEITVHVIHYTDFVSKLRSGAYTGEQIRGAWRSSYVSEGLSDNSIEHQAFATGANRAFSQTAQNVHNNIPQGQRPSYQAEIRQDIDNHVPSGKQPSYPI